MGMWESSGDGCHWYCNVNVLNATELYTEWFKWQILCYIYFATVFENFNSCGKDINILNWKIMRRHRNTQHRQYGAESDTHTLLDSAPERKKPSSEGCFRAECGSALSTAPPEGKWVIFKSSICKSNIIVVIYIAET